MDVGISVAMYLLSFALSIGGGSACLCCDIAIVSSASTDGVLARVWLSILVGLLFGMTHIRFAHAMILLLLCMYRRDVGRRLISGLLACVMLASACTSDGLY